MSKNSLMLSMVLLISLTDCLAGSMKNGFDLADALVPVAEIHSGGPPRDGIPAIDQPRFLTPEEGVALSPQALVLGLELNGIAKAYPLDILNWHEIVNDRFGDTPVVVSYCPLCGSGLAFHATVAGRAFSFGVSGLLYNSDLLLYDRQSESLWSQIKKQAISGPHKGQRLQPIALEQTTWSDWQSRHPKGVLLSRETGYSRDYDRSPYGGYEQSEDIYFPLRFRAKGYHPKERVIGVEADGRFKAYPFSELSKGKGIVHDQLGDSRITVHFDEDIQNARVLDEDGRHLPATVLFWFAWYAFHPDTAIYKASPE